MGGDGPSVSCHLLLCKAPAEFTDHNLAYGTLEVIDCKPQMACFALYLPDILVRACEIRWPLCRGMRQGKGQEWR